ncbi:L-rhamnonate dehydratase [Labrys wisconsinensis]|uniref:L-alanine-DL-glutamate epimerase-like enolase superfamily enzyme n=1 Tax=Labrys wisconsinensis TaxID=425677 RepID=A0ABU0IYI5_9HYPH|nr:L-rhamnonate dehydratase [Labrys wisconsinensis]MDQ0467067.1 L-alanine-DL-glutamate epimerase-like enolase superfamily enzyme [Labrys wisconsinensis]
MASPRIVDIRTYLVEGTGDGGDYHRQKGGHWIIDSLIANPMSGYQPYKASRLSWGIDVLGSILVEIEDDRGHVGFATGFGGPPACWLIEKHFRRFLHGADPRDTNMLWDQMFRASMFYGRKGLPLATISVVDLALWDLIGKLRQEPVYKLIGGRTKPDIGFYCTGPLPAEARRMGFWGGKVPLPHGPADGPSGVKANRAFLAAHREAAGPDFPLMVDCYMALTVPYAIEVASACADLDIHWWEEVLHPDDFDGFVHLKRALPTVKWTTGEHEYSRYGFRKLIEQRAVDILQPDVMWAGGLTELVRIAAHAAAYDVPVVPHGSGPYSYHFVMSQPNAPFCEYVANSPDGRSVRPVFGNLFTNEPVPRDGRLDVSDAPGFGLELAPDASLVRFDAAQA